MNEQTITENGVTENVVTENGVTENVVTESGVVEDVVTESGLVLANGGVAPIIATIDFKSGVKESTIDRVNQLTVKLIKDYTGVAKGYFSMVSSVAIMKGNGDYKAIQGIKSMPQYLTEVIKCSKSTASELVKVADTYYTSTGKLKDEEFSIFSYSELLKLAKYDDDVREEVKTRIQALESHTRSDVIKIADQVLNKQIGIKSTATAEPASAETEPATAETSTAEQPSVEVSTDEPKATPNTNYIILYKELYKKLVNLDLKSMKKDELVSYIEDTIFDMACELGELA